MADNNSGDSEQGPVFLRKRGIQMRMRCKPQVARQIEDAFVTVGQLVEAVESGKELTEYDGVGPATAAAIEEWWSERFEREESASPGTVEVTGKRSANIHFLPSWEGAIGTRQLSTEEDR